jgi:predicted acyltransferase
MPASATASANTPAAVPAPPPRLESLDALRGFAMFWIVGADALHGALSGLHGGPILQFITHQMDHAAWEGFHFFDLIFPLFVFVIGVSITLSLDRLVEREGRPAALQRVLRRGAIMFLLGLLYYGGLAEGYERIRLLGVLQRLALCYTATSLLYLYLKPRALLAVCVSLLLGYWALLTFVPVPGFGAGDFAEGHNLANWFDSQFLPLRKWKVTHDPEGILSTFPAIASCLLGVFAGLLMRDSSRPPREKLLWLAGAGVVFIVVGHLWGLQFPVIKRLWTSSYVLVAGGWSLLLLAAFYSLIDLRHHRAWAQPFVWVGANALTIYLLSNLIDFENLSARFLGGEIAAALDSLRPGLGGFTLALTGIALSVALCRFLYARKIFLRL